MTERKVNELFQYMEVETTTIRAYCINADDVDFDKLNETKPDFVQLVYRSDDPDRSKISFLVQVGGVVPPKREIEIIRWLDENV